MCKTTTDSNADIATTNTLGIHHLGLTVPDIKQTSAFFIDQMNFHQVGEKEEYPAIFISDGTVMLTLWQVNDSKNSVEFDRKNNVGLHHFALKVANVEHLQYLHQQFTTLDNVDIEFAPEPLGQSPFQHMMCIIPGGIRLELISA